MKIKPSMLSKEMLEKLVQFSIDKGIFKPELLQAAFKQDLHRQISNIDIRLKEINKELSNKRLSVKRHNELVGTYEHIATRGNKKIELYRKLEESGADK